MHDGAISESTRAMDFSPSHTIIARNSFACHHIRFEAVYQGPLILETGSTSFFELLAVYADIHDLVNSFEACTPSLVIRESSQVAHELAAHAGVLW